MRSIYTSEMLTNYHQTRTLFVMLLSVVCCPSQFCSRCACVGEEVCAPCQVSRTQQDTFQMVSIVSVAKPVERT